MPNRASNIPAMSRRRRSPKRKDTATDFTSEPSAKLKRPLPTRRQRPRLVALQLALLLASGLGASTVRGLVASERFGDEVNLVLAGSVGVGLILAAAFALRVALTRGTGLVLAPLPAGLLVICVAFARASIVDASVALESIAQASESGDPPASVALGPGGHDIRLSGELLEGVAHRVAVLLDTHPNVTRIHLTSEGGLADEGQALGDVIAARSLTTFVPDYCVSACTLAFVRGRERLALDDARLGFHAPYEQGLYGALYRGDASAQRAAYVAAGITPDFVDAALNVDPAGIWIPPKERLLAAHVVTAMVDHYKFPDSNLDGMPTLDSARTLILRNVPVMRAFVRGSPHAIDTIAAWYLDAYRRERSEGQNQDELGTIAHAAVALGLTRADDTTLVELAGFLMRGLSSPDAQQACDEVGGKVGGKVDLIAATARMGREADETAIELLERALTGGHPLAISAAQPVVVKTSLAWEKSCFGWRRDLGDMVDQGPGTVATTMRAAVESEARQSLMELQTLLKPHG